MFSFVRKYNFFYVLISYINVIRAVAVNKEVLEFSKFSQCKNNDYFNTLSFSCMKCDADKYLRPSADRLSCICNNFSKTIGFKDGCPVCIPCGENTTVTADGNDCVPCSSAMCKCTMSEIQIDRRLNGTLMDAMYCLRCPINTYPSLDESKCLPCKNLEYNYYKTNIYLRKQHQDLVKNHCLHSSTLFHTENLRDAFQVKFKSQTIDSYYFRSELQVTLHFCKRKDNLACVHLSNMCALSLYINDIPCKLFMQSQDPPVHLFYNKNENEAVLKSKEITQEYSLIKSNNASGLNFIAATFSLDGHFKALGTPNVPCNLFKHIKFGVNLKKKCKYTMADLMQAKNEFISPYLKFVRDNSVLFHALPILIKNINQNSSRISDWQLVRKFFLIDNVSGFKTLSNVTAGKAVKSTTLSVLRYVKSLSIIIDIQSINEKNKIYPPLMIIEYDELTHEEIQKIEEVELDFEIKYAMKDNNVHITLKISIGIFSGLALILASVKTWSYSKQHHSCIFNAFAITWFFIYAMSTVGSVIILHLICFSLYVFIFSCTSQSLLHILPPEDIGGITIKIFTIVAFLFKFVEMIGFICRYWNVDIFLIDWEQPKTVYKRTYKFSSTYAHMDIDKLHFNKLSKHKCKSGTMSTRPKKNTGNLNVTTAADSISSKIPTNECKESSNLSVSIWRTYFVASQWLNLQTKRKTNAVLQLIAVLFIHWVLQLYPWFFTIVELPSKFTEENYAFFIYYTICILIYTCIYCIQWLVSVIFYERCIINRMQLLIDLCSIANISVLILPFNYYGFYIHGRSVHGFADKDLPTLINDLQMEKDKLCAHRGLVPGTTQQTFILSLTKTFRISINQNCTLPIIKGNHFRKRYYSSSINWEEIFSSQLKLKQFLCNFIDQCSKTEDYIIKDQHFFEKLFNVVISTNDGKSIFYIDNNYSFNQTLLYGNEWLLATFETSVFVLIIVLCQDCTLASVVTALVSMLLTAIVKYRTKQNLINSTLLDKTYLTL